MIDLRLSWVHLWTYLVGRADRAFKLLFMLVLFGFDLMKGDDLTLISYQNILQWRWSLRAYLCCIN